MKSTFHEVYNDVEKAIDFAFNGKFVLSFYDYLKDRGTKRVEVKEFIESPTANELSELVMDLDDYLEGGADEVHKQLPGQQGLPAAKEELPPIELQQQVWLPEGQGVPVNAK